MILTVDHAKVKNFDEIVVMAVNVLKNYNNSLELYHIDILFENGYTMTAFPGDTVNSLTLAHKQKLLEKNENREIFWHPV